MKNRVRVTCNAEGKVIVISENNPEYGYIRVEQERAVFDEQTGFAKVMMLSALVPGTVKDLEKLGWGNLQVIPGVITIREQTLPFNRKNHEKNLKIAGETGIVCKVGEVPIYRNTFYNPNPSAQDVLISHTNRDEIKAAQNVLDVTEDNEDLNLS